VVADDSDVFIDRKINKWDLRAPTSLAYHENIRANSTSRQGAPRDQNQDLVALCNKEPNALPYLYQQARNAASRDRKLQAIAVPMRSIRSTLSSSIVGVGR